MSQMILILLLTLSVTQLSRAADLAGDICDGDRNPCVRGVCISDVGLPEGFVCLCNPCSHGTFCEGDPCDSKPCGQGIKCSVTETDPCYKCSCPPEVMGTNCDTPSPPCDDNKCLNGGICYNGWDVICVCPDGFVGDICEYERPIDCGTDGDRRTIFKTKTVSYNSRTCTYLADEKVPSWTGKYESDCFNAMRDEYNPAGEVYQPGVNGEFIHRQEVSLTSCIRAQHSTWIEFQICCSSCASNPCQNGGWCMQDGESDGFICRCRLGFGGFLCENELTSCFSAGDPHIYTFDGDRYDFQGLCKYTMVENLSADDLPPFKVTTKNEPRGTSTDVTDPKYVETEVYGYVIRLDKGNVVIVDGQDVTNQLPFHDPTGQNRFVISLDGMNTRLGTDFWLIVEYDGDWLINVQVPTEASGKVDGLCRQYDGDSTNEYILPDGTDVTDDPDSQSIVGNFFQVADPEDPSCEPRNQPNPPECDASTTTTIDSNDYCGQIQNPDGPFARCVQAGGIIVEMYMENCRYDVCAASPDGTDAMKAAACSSLKAFEVICGSKSLPPDDEWRQTTNCVPECPGDLVYKASTSACNPTCQQPNYREQCPFEDTENCVCEDSTNIVTEDNRCVMAQECGCVDENRAIGDIWMKRYQCVECTTCARPVGEVTIEAVGCPEGQLWMHMDTGATCSTPPSEWECKPLDPDSDCACVAVP